MAESSQLQDGRVRRPVLALMAVGLAAVTLVGAIVAAVLAAFVVDHRDIERIGAVDPVAPTALPGERLAWAERTSGRVRVVRLDRFGDEAPGVLASVPDELRTDGQRGLLGLAQRTEDGDTVLYASWTRAGDSRLVVGRLGPDPRLVWEGPVSAELANGGALAFRGGDLLVGVGELQDASAVADPMSPNGKILALDPGGSPDQRPEVVSSGWHNPYAMAVVGDEVWLLDNAPGDIAERIARIPGTGEPVVESLPGRRAPSSMTPDGRGSLLVCGFVRGTVERFVIPAEGVPTEGRDTEWPCATGVEVVGDRVVTTTLDAVLRLDHLT